MQYNIINVFIFCDNGVGLLVRIIAINAWTCVDNDSVCPELHGTQQVIPEFWHMDSLVYDQVVSDSCKRAGVSQRTSIDV